MIQAALFAPVPEGFVLRDHICDVICNMIPKMNIYDERTTFPS